MVFQKMIDTLCEKLKKMIDTLCEKLKKMIDECVFLHGIDVVVEAHGLHAGVGGEHLLVEVT